MNEFLLQRTCRGEISIRGDMLSYDISIIRLLITIIKLPDRERVVRKNIHGESKNSSSKLHMHASTSSYLSRIVAQHPLSSICYPKISSHCPPKITLVNLVPTLHLYPLSTPFWMLIAHIYSPPFVETTSTYLMHSSR